MNKKRVLITGASGFIGQFVLREIVKTGFFYYRH